jgi:hypothetical protein
VIFKPFRLILLISLVLFLLAACSPSSAAIIANNSQYIENGSSFGQTFTARNDGLSGVSVLLGPAPDSPAGSLFFHLRTSPQSEENIASARLPIAEVDHQGFYKFDFPPINDSRGKDYYLDVEVDSQGGTQIYTGEPDSYIEGSLYINQIPQEAQLGFHLNYDAKYYILGMTKLLIQWVGILSISIFAFVLPGWAAFSLLWCGWDKLNWWSKLGLSSGLSLAIYPLFMLWSYLIGLHLGIVYAFLPAIVGIVVLIWKNQKSIRKIPSDFRQKNSLFTRHNLPSMQVILADLAALIVVGLIITSRFWVIRSLDVPLFGDSYQHTMISQLIIDHGGLFSSWEPYADLVTFTYHFGFHSAVAIFHWISGLSVEKSVLWTGQIINVLAILGLFPLAYKITNNRWAGVIAMLIGGLLSPMPMYYVNWGRYTQLAGQAILPAVIWCIWSILDKPHPDLENISFIKKLASWRSLSLDLGSMIIAWILLGGLALTHYRIIIIAVLFIPAYEIFHFSRKAFIIWFGRVAWIGLGGLLLFLPWFIHVFSGKIINLFTAQVTTLPAEAASSTQIINSIGNIRSYLPLGIWFLFLICVGWGLVKRNTEISTITIWWFFAIILSNLNLIGLPGSGVLTNFAIFIAIYIPASLVIGPTLILVVQNIQRPSIAKSLPLESNKRLIFIDAALMIAICVFGIWGLSNRVKDLNLSSFALVTRPDMRAMTWIRENSPEDANFLVNSFFAFYNSVVAGSDGGWWIPLLAERKTSLPPLTYGFEEGVGSATTQTANSLAREIQTKGIGNPEIISLLIQKGIKYLYIGQRQGSINYDGPQVLDPKIISSLPNFNEIYHQDRVWIFEVIP